MEEQQTGFNVTPEGVDLLAQILEFASVSVYPNHDWESGAAELTGEQQELVMVTAGGVLVEILRQVALAEGVAD